MNAFVDDYQLLDDEFDYQDDGDPHYVPVQFREIQHAE